MFFGIYRYGGFFEKHFCQGKLHNLIILDLILWTAKQSLNSVMCITPLKLWNQNLYM